MKLILVDTPSKIVTSVEVGAPLRLPLIYALLGCDMIEAHGLPGVPNHAFYCDELGRQRTPLPPCFDLEGFPCPIYGRILIFRAWRDLEMSATVPVETVSARISFR